jgi:hypothetical protein
MNMKKLFNSISFFLLAAVLFSCNKFLDVQPKNSVSDEVTIFNKASSEQALRGVYNALASSNYYGTGFQSIGYLSGDNVQWTGSQSQVQEFINHDVSAENSTIAGAWSAIYQVINRANNVIAKVPSVVDPQLTDAFRNQLIGEAYFIRALAYFDLVRTWGGVPLITSPTTSPKENSGIARSTADATYNQVISDLENADALLPETTNRYRATRKTVYALKARYYLYRGQWAEAEQFASLVINDSASYRLVGPYNSFFAADARGTVESVFEIFYNGTTEVNGHRNQWQPQTNGGTRQWAPSPALLALLSDPVTAGNRTSLVGKDNQGRWYGNLYYRNPASDPSWVIRVAELYLIRAEARAQLQNTAGALEDLNRIRYRSGLLPASENTSDLLLLAIEQERRLEFAFEPHRWFDLVRTNRAITVLGFTDVNKLVLPIPSQQILVDKALVQNPGY